MQEKKSKVEQAFFALLRAGLWEQEVQLAPYGEIDFAEVKRSLIKRCEARGMEDGKIRATLWCYGFGQED